MIGIKPQEQLLIFDMLIFVLVQSEEVCRKDVNLVFFHNIIISEKTIYKIRYINLKQSLEVALNKKC